MCKWQIAAWENSPHFVTPPVVSSWNDAWETSTEIPYWWRTVPTSMYSFWLVENLLHPIRSSTQIWVVTGHQYGISALVSYTSLGVETTGSVAKYRLFSLAKGNTVVGSCILHLFMHTKPKVVLNLLTENLLFISTYNRRQSSFKVGVFMVFYIGGSNNDTKLHGGNRGGKAWFSPFEVSKTSESPVRAKYVNQFCRRL